MGCLKLSYYTPTLRALEKNSFSHLQVVEKKGARVKKCLNYYPFGMLMPGRHASSGDYRYGFNQGSERDDEIKGKGNSYTTFYRQLDTRLGRWLSIDPKMSAGESPYVSMGNTPIWANDVNGDKFKKKKHKEKLEKKVKKRKNQIESNIASIENKIKDIDSQISMEKEIQIMGGESMDGTTVPDNILGLEKEKTEFEKQLSQQNWMLGEMNASLKEIDRMEKSDVLFVTRRQLNFWSATGGTYGKSNKKVIIGFGNFSAAIHEFHHGYQFLTGEVSFSNSSTSGPGLYDVYDEISAYRRDYAFNPKQSSYKNISNRSSISYSKIKSIYYQPGRTPIALNNRNLDNYKGSLNDQFIVSPSDRITK